MDFDTAVMVLLMENFWNAQPEIFVNTGKSDTKSRPRLLEDWVEYNLSKRDSTGLWILKPFGRDP